MFRGLRRSRARNLFPKDAAFRWGGCKSKRARPPDTLWAALLTSSQGWPGLWQSWAMRFLPGQWAAAAFLTAMPWEIIAKKFRSEEHTSELQSRPHLVCRLLLEKKKHLR